MSGAEEKERWRKKGGRAESFIIIRRGNAAAPVGRYSAGDKEYVWEIHVSLRRNSRTRE